MGLNIFRAMKQRTKCFGPLWGWGHAPPENFENVGSQIAGNCISGLISNLTILLWLDRFNNKITRDVRYLSKADAFQMKIRMAS